MNKDFFNSELDNLKQTIAQLGKSEGAPVVIAQGPSTADFEDLKHLVIQLQEDKADKSELHSLATRVSKLEKEMANVLKRLDELK